MSLDIYGTLNNTVIMHGYHAPLRKPYKPKTSCSFSVEAMFENPQLPVEIRAAGPCQCRVISRIAARLSLEGRHRAWCFQKII